MGRSPCLCPCCEGCDALTWAVHPAGRYRNLGDGAACQVGDAHYPGLGIDFVGVSVALAPGGHLHANRASERIFLLWEDILQATITTDNPEDFHIIAKHPVENDVIHQQ